MTRPILALKTKRLDNIGISNIGKKSMYTNIFCCCDAGVVQEQKSKVS